MKTKLNLIIALVITTALLGAGAPAAGIAPSGGLAYVEPNLTTQETGSRLSVIVSAGDSAQAARAVQQVGGAVTADLWLINAVAATLSPQQLPALAGQPGITSIVADKRVQAAGGGWVTDMRVQKASYTLSTTLTNPVAYLPDGAYVAVSQGGELLIVDAAGGQRARLTLPGGPYTSAPTIGPDGTIYVAGQVLRLSAFNPNGSMRWQYVSAGSFKFLGSPLLGSDGTLYIVDSGRNVYALDSATGQLRWKRQVGSAGAVLTTPALGPDNTLYFTTDKGYVYAVNSNCAPKWTYSSAVTLKLSPVVAGSRLYVASDAKKLFALDAATGTSAYTFVTAGAIRAVPVVASDGRIYLPTETGVYGLNPDGTQRFYFLASGGKFITTPALASDEKTLYATVAGKNVFAIHTASGAQKWVYLMAGNMLGGPVLDADGGIIVGDDVYNLVRLSPTGKVSYQNVVADKITQSASASPAGDVTVRVGSLGIVTLGRMPDRWDGRPDVQATNNKTIYKIVNPVSIDVGADVLHRTQLTPSRTIICNRFLTTHSAKVCYTKPGDHK